MIAKDLHSICIFLLSVFFKYLPLLGFNASLKNFAN